MIRVLRRTMVLAATAWMAGACLAWGAFDSTASSSLVVSTLVIPAVTDVTVQLRDSCALVDVQWSPAAASDAVLVEVSRTGGPWTSVATIAGGAGPFTDTGSGGATHVRYRVTPMDSTSGWSGPATTSDVHACS